MELEIKHIVPYLPFGLKVQYTGIINGKELSEYKKKYKKLCGDDIFPDYSNDQIIEQIGEMPEEKIGLKIGKIRIIEMCKEFTKYRIGGRGMQTHYGTKNFKLLLYPLHNFGDSDDLRKIHEFIGLGKWCEAYDYYFNIWFDDLANTDKLILQAPYEIFDYFLANHFDVFGLIPKGLAVDITL